MSIEQDVARLIPEPRCPECNLEVSRPKCLFDMGAACPRHPSATVWRATIRAVVAWARGLVAENKPQTGPACWNCQQPATCFGSYEQSNWDYACDECCGHGCEDGRCFSVTEFGEQFVGLQAELAALRQRLADVEQDLETVKWNRDHGYVKQLHDLEIEELKAERDAALADANEWRNRVAPEMQMLSDQLALAVANCERMLEALRLILSRAEASEDQRMTDWPQVAAIARTAMGVALAQPAKDVAPETELAGRIPVDIPPVRK